MSDARFLTAGQVGELLNVSKWWAFDHQAQLGAVKFGRAVRFPRERVEAYIAERVAEAERTAAAKFPTSGTSESAGEAGQPSPRRRRRRRVPLAPATGPRPRGRV